MTRGTILATVTAWRYGWSGRRSSLKHAKPSILPLKTIDYDTSSPNRWDTSASVSVVRVALITALLIATVTLQGCGGGTAGGSQPPGGEMPPNGTQQQIQAFIERARSAESAALSSAAQAAIQCDSAPTACTAAANAANQFFLAEAARIEAEASTTVARAERAAIAAEHAADNAANAAAEAILIASMPPTVNPEPPSLPDWLLSGTVASAQARDTADNIDFSRFDFDTAGSDYLSVGETADFAVSRPEFSEVSLFSTGPFDHGVWNLLATQWGYWAQPTMSTGIQKIQHTLVGESNTGSIATTTWTHRSIFGILSHSIFGLAHQSRHHEDSDEIQLRQAFFEIDSSEFFLNEDRSLDWSHIESLSPTRYAPSYPNIIYVGARWEGDSFAHRRADLTPVYGPASLTVTSFKSELGGGGRRDPGEFGFRFVANYNDGGRVEEDELDGSSGSYISGPPDLSRTFHAFLTGTNADEVVGGFSTPEYRGSFGLKRE